MIHALIAVAIGLVGSIALYPVLVSELSRRRFGQRIQSYSPGSHRIKAGTPTMGGLLFDVLVVAAWLVLDRSRTGFVLCFALIAGGAIGMLDDLDNVRGKAGLGLGVAQKLALQAVAGVLVGVGLYEIHATGQLIPGVGVRNLGVFIIPLATIAVMACTNAVNLTDGVDGLAASCTVIAFGALLVVALHVHAVASVAVCAAAIGGLVGFLVFNWHPARIFMGDTGSLALGALLAALACELQLLWLLPLLGLVFAIEVLSVIVNVTAITRFHHRILRASPLHGHFEELGVGEHRLVLGFTVAAAVCAAAALLLVPGIA